MSHGLRALRLRPEIFKQHILDAGHTPSGFGLHCGVGRTTVWRLVGGEKHIVTAHTAEAIAKGLDLPVEDLFVVTKVPRAARVCRGCGTACATCGPVAA